MPTTAPAAPHRTAVTTTSTTTAVRVEVFIAPSATNPKVAAMRAPSLAPAWAPPATSVAPFPAQGGREHPAAGQLAYGDPEEFGRLLNDTGG